MKSASVLKYKLPAYLFVGLQDLSCSRIQFSSFLYYRLERAFCTNLQHQDKGPTHGHRNLDLFTKGLEFKVLIVRRLLASRNKYHIVSAMQIEK